jgi:hypothetical protein
MLVTARAMCASLFGQFRLWVPNHVQVSPLRVTRHWSKRSAAVNSQDRAASMVVLHCHAHFRDKKLHMSGN